jgi:uncharacterized cupredoxin-like copper-binding protein
MKRRFITGLILMGVLLAMLSACGPPPPQKVEVTLTDFGVESSVSEFKVGQPYEFVVTNKGAIPHEFMIMAPLSMDEMDMTMDMMDAQALTMVEEDDLPAGATANFEYTFPKESAGESLEFACHVQGHYEQGMKMAITVN